MAERIGFLGVGLMGHGMAKNLLEKGHAVSILGHRNRAPVESLVAKGAVETLDPKTLAQNSDILFICVTGSPQVEANIYGDNGILAGAHTDLLVVDHSTSEPDSTARIAADLGAAGAEMADAPLARTPIEAEAGKLNTMVGASDSVFARLRPLLECYCENIFHVGGVGAGHKTKLINNFLAMGHAALIAEALAACAATGVDIQKYHDVVSAGGANSGIFQLIVPKAMNGDFSGLKFSLANAAKDLRYYTRMTESVPLTGNLGNAVQHAFIQGMTLGFDDGYVGDLINVQTKLNGRKVL